MSSHKYTSYQLHVEYSEYFKRLLIFCSFCRQKFLEPILAHANVDIHVKIKNWVECESEQLWVCHFDHYCYYDLKKKTSRKKNGIKKNDKCQAKKNNMVWVIRYVGRLMHIHTNTHTQLEHIRTHFGKWFSNSKWPIQSMMKKKKNNDDDNDRIQTQQAADCMLHQKSIRTHIAISAIVSIAFLLLQWWHIQKWNNLFSFASGFEIGSYITMYLLPHIAPHHLFFVFFLLRVPASSSVQYYFYLYFVVLECSIRICRERKRVEKSELGAVLLFWILIRSTFIVDSKWISQRKIANYPFSLFLFFSNKWWARTMVYSSGCIATENIPKKPATIFFYSFHSFVLSFISFGIRLRALLIRFCVCAKCV